MTTDPRPAGHVELNVGLSAADRTTAEVILLRFERDYLPQVASVFSARLHKSTYPHPDGDTVEEHTIVVRMTLRVDIPMQCFVGWIYTTALLYEQDCIAVRWASGRGQLIGPAAKNWGEFSSEYFERY